MYVFEIKEKKLHGFALTEAVVALFFVSIVIAVIAGLGQQVLNFSKSSKQTGAVIEIRNRVNSLTRNTDEWMNRLRSSAETASIFSDCLPDSLIANGDYNCPQGDETLFDKDSKLSELAGTELNTIIDTPLVDNGGIKIAGDLANPVYMSSDGGPCSSTQPETNCALKSTGYFLRSNPSQSENPGAVKFIIKIERNLVSKASSGVGAMKPQYMSVDIGTEWQRTAKGCPKGSLKMGYLSNGNPFCVNPTQSCANNNEIAVGVGPTGAPVCISKSCPSGELPVFDQTSNGLKCSANSPCPQGSVFLGYYGTNGEKICSTFQSCGSNEVQVGVIPQGDGSALPSCLATPSECAPDKIIGLVGNTFTCIASTGKVACDPATHEFSGIDTNGSAICTAKNIVDPPIEGNTNLQGLNVSCASGVLKGMKWNKDLNNGKGGMEAICESMPTHDSNEVKLAGRDILPGWNGNLSTSFSTQAKIWPLSCMANGKTYSCGYHHSRFYIAPDASLNTVATINPPNANTSRRCMYLDGTWRILLSQDGKYKYPTICQGGIMYKDFPSESNGETINTSDPSRLLNTNATTPSDTESAISILISGNDSETAARLSPPILNSKDVEIYPTLSELINYISSACQEESENFHCKKYKEAINERREDLRSKAFSNGKAPNYCRVTRDSKPYAYTCGTGCDLGLGIKPIEKTSTGRIKKYRYIYRWARNYDSDDAGRIASGNAYFFRGELCIASGHNDPKLGAIRYAPLPPNDGEMQLSED